MDLIGLIVWIILVVLVVAAVLAVVRALLALPPFAGLQPYTALIYALFGLLVILIVVSMFYGSGPVSVPRLRR